MLAFILKKQACGFRRYNQQRIYEEVRESSNSFYGQVVLGLLSLLPSWANIYTTVHTTIKFKKLNEACIHFIQVIFYHAASFMIEIMLILCDHI